MTAVTVFDLEPIVWTIILLGFFATLAGFVVVLNAVIRDLIGWWQRRHTTIPDREASPEPPCAIYPLAMARSRRARRSDRRPAA